MNEERNMLARRPADALDEPVTVEADEAQPVSPFRKLHQLLAGRYLWAILLGTVLATGFAGLAYQMSARQYQSSGLIQFQPYTPQVLFENPDPGLSRAFDSFVNNQVELMQSRRVIDMAMNSDLWAPYRREELAPDQRYMAFESNLTIDRRRGGSSVWLRYTSTDPQESMYAVKAVVAAYERLYEEQNVMADTERLRVLEQRRSSLSNQLQSLRQQVLNEAREYGVEGLAQIHQAKIRDLSRVESQLNEVRIALALSVEREPDGDQNGRNAQPGGAEANADGESGNGQGESDDPAEIPVARLALRDNQLARMLQEQAQLERQLERLKEKFGPQHQAVLNAQDELAAARETIHTRADVLRAQQREGIGDAGEMDPQLAWTRSVDELRTQENRLEQRYEQLNEEVMQLGRRRLEIDRVREEMASTESKLEQTRSRLDQLSVESTVGGRMRVVTDGDPGVLSRDRKIKLAGVGGMGGLFLGFAIVATIGSFDPKIRRADQMAGFNGAGLLGILPTLPEDLTTGEAMEATRHSVHHIRTMLQVSAHTRQSRVLTVTGPTIGSGKTSLTIALGLSYAAGGGRTLLIDADLGSGAMTHAMDRIIRRRIGEILVERGMVSQSRLDTALHLARTDGRRLGEVLVEMGDLDAEQVSEALAVQESATVGLIDAICGKSLGDCTVDTGVDNLFILPIGDATTLDTPRLSPASVQDLLQRAADQFDMVLIDVGPTPGGSQSALFGAASDNVVLVVSRGDNRERTRETIDFLQGIDARVAGLVFNRASLEDVKQSAFSSHAQISQAPASRNGHGPRTPGPRRLGPMAHAMSSAAGDAPSDLDLDEPTDPPRRG